MTRICHIDDVEDNSSSSIQVDYLELLVVKAHGQLFLYENICPHAADTLDPLGTSVVSGDGLLIHCQRHGAEFLVDSGQCVAGPCLGEQLRSIPFTLSGGEVYLD
jgi:nitrite reductase/ring-hydroxylating ferredoxin subunit